jgi:hypothetical protein
MIIKLKKMPEPMVAVEPVKKYDLVGGYQYFR